MKRNTTSFLLMLLMMLSLCFLCTACGKDAKSADSAESVNHTENVDRAESNTISPENDLNEGLGGDFPIYNEDNGNEVSWYGGLWLSEVTDQYDYLSIDAVGNWQLYSDGNVIDEGYLWYDSEWDITYITSYQVGAADGGQVEMEGDQLYITTLGYFSNCASEDDIGDGYYSWDSELCQRNVSELEGVWYCDGDFSATTYIVIDGYGNWSYYQRVPGDAEGTEMDYGTFSYSTDECSIYYADSAVYNGISFRVFEFDEDTLVWDNEGTFYRMEW